MRDKVDSALQFTTWGRRPTDGALVDGWAGREFGCSNGVVIYRSERGGLSGSSDPGRPSFCEIARVPVVEAKELVRKEA
jgi:hypothetical protein